MKHLSKIVFFVSLFSFRAVAHDKKPWVYFDLGDTVISTKDPKHFKYMNGAREYIEQLKREGFNVGMISNIPENWGIDYEEKLLTLKKYIQDHWDGDRPFDWTVYDEVILPLKNSEMKPSPTLFLKAINNAESCPSIYIGENLQEILAAKDSGMSAKLYETTYLPIEQVKTYIIENYHLNYDKNCL
jgi:phosphoglycolate phosphatase-like HAD superfamily hydrolase